MSARYFADYVVEFRSSGALSIDSPALVCHSDGEIESERTFDTAMGSQASRPSLVSVERGTDMGLRLAAASARSLRAPSSSTPSLRDLDPLRLVFPVCKRPGNAFDHISVGRTPNMDVVLPLLQVSKFHAYFTRDPSGQFTLADAGSKNGTWINARRVGVRSPESVHDGDSIRLGAYRFTFFTQAGLLRMVKSRSAQGVQ